MANRILNYGLVQSAMAVLLDFALPCDAKSTLWDRDGQANHRFSIKMSGLFFHDYSSPVVLGFRKQ